MNYVVGALDSMSAACLLERYIEDEGDGSIIAPKCSYPPPPELEIFDINELRMYHKLKQPRTRKNYH